MGRTSSACTGCVPSPCSWGQLRNPLLLLLLVAAGVSGLTGDPTGAIIIAVIVALSVGLGFVNEFRAAIAVEQLHDRVRREAVVWRDGRQRKENVTQLVPGDVVALRIGDIVPADIRLFEADQLESDESVLTGESLPVSKDVAPVAGGADADLSSCVFMGTIVQQGSGRGWRWAPGLDQFWQDRVGACLTGHPKPGSRSACGNSPSCWRR